LSLKKSCSVTAEGMRAFSTLLNLENLDMERCSGIHGGLVHLKGLSFCLINASGFFDVFFREHCIFALNCMLPRGVNRVAQPTYDLIEFQC
jgi:hypothetical protein